MPKTLTIRFPDDEQGNPEFEYPIVPGSDPNEVPRLVKRAYDYLKAKHWPEEVLPDTTKKEDRG